MPRRAAATIRPLFDLDRAVAVPLHRQLYDCIRVAVLAGQLPAGARLPAVLGLASHLGMAGNTGANAYEQLQAEGFLVSKVGSGTTVASGLPDNLVPTTGGDYQAIAPTPDLPGWQGPTVTGEPPLLRAGVP